MKKFAKMSLVAAIAVAGTVASAQPLAEAIKNVDVSGTAAYRYNDYELAGEASNNYKVAVSLKSKVTDDVTFNTRLIAGNGTANASLGTSTTADSNLDLELSEVNFTYTGIANTSITLGKQALNTKFSMARDAMGNEQTGTGLLAMSTFGPATIYGAYFNQTTLNTSDNAVSGLTTGAEDVVVVGVDASFGMINVDASYIDVADAFDAYTVGLGASYDLGSVALSSFARYTELDLEDSNLDNSLWKVGIAANMGIFGAHLSYGETDEEGGVVGTDYSSTTGFDEHWRVTLSDISDASALYAGIDAQVTDKIKVALNYSDIDAGSASNAQDQTEVFGQITYNHAKNLSSFVRFGQLDADRNNEKETMGRLHIQYSF